MIVIVIAVICCVFSGSSNDRLAFAVSLLVVLLDFFVRIESVQRNDFEVVVVDGVEMLIWEVSKEIWAWVHWPCGRQSNIIEQAHIGEVLRSILMIESLGPRDVLDVFILYIILFLK